MRIACSRTLGSRAESGDSQCRPVETLDTTRPALSTLRRSSRISASVVDIWNHGTSPSHSSMPSNPDFLTSSSPCSKLHPLGIMLSPMDFFMLPSIQENRRCVTIPWREPRRGLFRKACILPQLARQSDSLERGSGGPCGRRYNHLFECGGCLARPASDHVDHGLWPDRPLCGRDEGRDPQYPSRRGACGHQPRGGVVRYQRRRADARAELSLLPAWDHSPGGC